MSFNYGKGAMIPDSERGLYNKFNVTRADGTSGPGGKHEGCEYFVLDLVHDSAAWPALVAYEAAIRETHPQLAADLRRKLNIMGVLDV